MEFAGSISLETVRPILKKTNSNHGRRKSGASPKVSGEFVAWMEDVLDVPRRPATQSDPWYVLDETSRQLVEE